MSLAFFDGNGEFTDTCITSSRINSSTIDMGGNKITGAGDPVALQDVVTLSYLQSFTHTNGNSGIGSSTIVSLVSTLPTLAFNVLKGTFLIKVENIVTNGPSAIFNATKSESTRYPLMSRSPSSNGFGANTSLLIEWGIGSGISLKKTDASYDGEYKISLI